MASERQWYPVIETWLKEVKGCMDVQSEFCFYRSGLASGDVVGWVAARRDNGADFACELKSHPLPAGSDGYGAVRTRTHSADPGAMITSQHDTTASSQSPKVAVIQSGAYLRLPEPWLSLWLGKERPRYGSRV